jgi:hypothetical protein
MTTAVVKMTTVSWKWIHCKSLRCAGMYDQGDKLWHI